MTPEQAASRPRVEGDREAQILDATIDVLVEVGYDRLTMDAVAQCAKASKATLYRRWESKPALVFEAICSRKGATVEPDTGNLRDDLIASHCSMGAFGDTQAPAVIAAVVTAMSRDAEFVDIYRREFVNPKIEAARRVYQRAIARGEIPEDTDVDLLAPALAGIVLHRSFLMGDHPSPDLITRIVDHVILPAARAAVSDSRA